MSLRTRQYRNQQSEGQGSFTTATQIAQPTTPVQLVSGRDYFAVVDGEIVNVIGTTDIPGMSVAYWCQSDEDGSSAAVSHKEAPIFTTPQRALQFLQEQRGVTGNPTRNRAMQNQ